MRQQISFVAAFFGVVLVLAGSTPAAAIELRGGQKVTIAAEEVITDDLYATGEVVTINGFVEGDLVATGREIIVNGGVLGDLIAAGQAVVINGQVGDDVRVAGMALQLGENAAIGDDVIGAGFSLEAVEGSLVAGSVVFTGFQALLAGEVGERLLGQMVALQIEGILEGGGEVQVEGGEETPPFVQFLPSPVQLPTVASGLTVASSARVNADLVYTSPTAADAPASTENLVHIESAPEVSEPSAVDRALKVGKRWAAILVAGLVLLLAAPRWLGARSENLAARPFVSAAWGIGGLVALPVLILLGAAFLLLFAILLGLLSLDSLVATIVLGGLLLTAALAFGVWLALSLIAPGAGALSLGRGIGRKLGWRLGASGAEAGRGVSGFLVGWVVLALLSLIPLLGGLVGVLVAILGFGSIVAWAARPLTRLGR